MLNNKLKLACLVVLVAVCGACDGSSLTGPEDIGPDEIIESPQNLTSDALGTDETESQDTTDSSEDDPRRVKPQE